MVAAVNAFYDCFRDWERDDSFQILFPVVTELSVTSCATLLQDVVAARLDDSALA